MSTAHAESAARFPHVFAQRLWRTRQDACTDAPFGFLNAGEGHLLYYLTRDYYRGIGVIVDGGSFLGRSAWFLAAGIQENPFMDERRAPFIHCFDNFVVNDESTANVIRDFLGQHLVPGDSTRFLFDRATHPIRRWLDVWQGDFHLSQWRQQPVEILFIDIAKSASLNRKLVETMFPCLLPGVSVVIHQDYHHPWLPHIHLTMECLHEYFEIVEPRVDDSIAFLYTRPIPHDVIQVAANIRETLDFPQQLELMNRAIARLPEKFRHHLELAKAVLIGQHQGADPMQSALDVIDKQYVVPQNDTNWQKYRVDVHTFLDGLRNKNTRRPHLASIESVETVERAMLRQSSVASPKEATIAALQRELATRNEAILRAHEQLRRLPAFEPPTRANNASTESDRALKRALDGANRQVSLMRQSFSWRATAPIRAIYRRLGGRTADEVPNPDA